MMATDHGRYKTLIDAGRGNLPITEEECAGGFARSQPRQIYLSDIPPFMGSECIEGFLEWVADVEEFFATITISEEKMVKIISWRLKCYMALWWDRMLKSRRQQGKDTIKTWRRMKRIIVKYWYPLEYDLYLLRTGQKIVKEEEIEEVVVNEMQQDDEPHVSFHASQGVDKSNNLVIDKIVGDVSDLVSSQCIKDDLKTIDDPTSGHEVQEDLIKEFDYQDAYSTLVYGVGSIVFPVTHQEYCTPRITNYIFSSSFTTVRDQFLFKENSRSSSLQVKGSDVGQRGGQLKWKKGRKAYRWDFWVD